MTVAIWCGAAAALLWLIALGAFVYAMHTSSGHGVVNLPWLAIAAVLAVLGVVCVVVAVVAWFANGWMR